MQPFEEFLQEKFIKNYSGTGDDAPERFDTWLENLDTQELMDYAQEAMDVAKIDGKREMLEKVSPFFVSLSIEMDNMIKGIKNLVQ